MRKFIYVLVFMLGACATNPEMRLLQACQGYASTLTSLATMKVRDQLSTSDIQVINALRPSLNEICREGDYLDPVLALQTVEGGLFELLRIEAQDGN